MSQVDDGIDVLIDLLGIAATVAAQLDAVSAIIKQARSEGRKLTDAELDMLRQKRLDARKAALEA